MAAHPDRLVVVGPTLTLDRGVGIGICEGNSRLHHRLDEAIGAMKKDGSLNALIRRWFGADATGF